MRFIDRQEAGRKLAALLAGRAGSDALVVALPRGGVPVAAEVARALGAELDVLVVRKLGAPSQPELGMGAIAEGGAVFVDRDVVRMLGVGADQLSRIAERESIELDRRARLYRGGRPFPDLAGRTAVLVDDGIATGGSVRAAIRALRELHPARLILAVPVMASSLVPEFHQLVDDLVCVTAPDDLGAVGFWYQDFRQVGDDEVLALLAEARTPAAPRQAEPQAVVIPCEEGALEGLLGIPAEAHGLVIFAHGSGSSRFSRRNQHVAHRLRDAGFATLLLDLLTPAEESLDELTGQLRFNIDLLAGRLADATRFALRDARLRPLSIGYFGASTGAAAALAAAAELPETIRAVVSRGGRPDLAGRAALVRVSAPTLLIVGGNDPTVLQLNREALPLLAPEKELVVVPGATHLFEEPGALDEVARLAAEWFAKHLGRVEAPAWPEGRLP